MYGREVMVCKKWHGVPLLSLLLLCLSLSLSVCLAWHDGERWRWLITEMLEIGSGRREGRRRTGGKSPHFTRTEKRRAEEGGHVPTRRNSIQSHETDNNNQVGSWEEGRGGGQTPAAHRTSVVKPSLSRGQSIQKDRGENWPSAAELAFLGC